jgi:hypothetical protein
MTIDLTYLSGDTQYVLTFPVCEIGNAIALCGWTLANPIRTHSQAAADEVRRLESLESLSIPDGTDWFKRYARRCV